ncbi:hypothetical protein [Candidatus Magnetaquicoccus inordinatus]|uniref:hypothetical protein n=1 Tax=Candidatus Magnetaquicoccus inordinatus TaxID=2496818 RepID=UPI00102C6856|nr:hypothetical protein [Candidatus Magnetaquicoccus inordinatus]
MSRSRRKHSLRGSTHADSEKQDKRLANRRTRRRNRIRVAQGEEPVHRHLTANVWLMDKDGKIYFDRRTHPRLMRK